MNGPNGDTVPSGREPVTPSGAPEPPEQTQAGSPTPSSTEPPATTPSVGPPASPPKRRRTLVLVVIGVVVVLVAGFLVWKFLLQPPVPSDLQVTDSSFASITLAWSWEEDADPTGFVVLRDGVEVATLAGTETSYEDTGVQPATEYTYAVHAEIEGERSESGAELTASTPEIPAPANLQVAEATFASAELTWDWADVPPEVFVVTRDGVEIAEVPGTETSYIDPGLDPETTYAYTVAAFFGGATGAPTNELTATTLAIPPLSEAEFSGSYGVSVRFRSASNFPGITIGRGGTTTPWIFEPRSGGPKVTAFLFGPPAGGWNMRLEGSGVTYRDTTKTAQSNCGGVPVVDTVDVTIRIERADLRGGEWLVTKWSGKLKLQSPQAQSGLLSCPPGSFVADLTGRLQ